MVELTQLSGPAQPMNQGPADSRNAVAAVSQALGSSHDPALLAALGAFLESARQAAGLTPRDLEPIVGSAVSVRAIERGSVRTRVSRLRPWLERLGVDPDPVIARFGPVIAPEAQDGRPRWKPKVARKAYAGNPAADPLAPPQLAAFQQAALGADLWRIRVQAGLTRPALAQLVAVSRVTIWLVEHGHRHPSERLLDAWLTAGGQAFDRQLLALRFPGRIRPSRRAAVGMVPPDQSHRAPTGRIPESVGPSTSRR